jgi:hypothetical protein
MLGTVNVRNGYPNIECWVGLLHTHICTTGDAIRDPGFTKIPGEIKIDKVRIITIKEIPKILLDRKVCVTYALCPDSDAGWT